MPLMLLLPRMMVMMVTMTVSFSYNKHCKTAILLILLVLAAVVFGASCCRLLRSVEG